MATRSTQRKERLRQATRDEIRATARRFLVEHGSSAVTVNAIAREMGLSGPALYHYYAGHDELVDALVADFYSELTTAVADARDALPQATPVERLLATCRAMRAWAIAHPTEFRWIFTKPVPESGRSDEAARYRTGSEFENVFLDQFVQLWNEAPFPVPDLEELAPSLRDQLRAYTAKLGERLPAEAAHVFLTCWMRLYGLLCMEVLHQLDFAFTDPEPVFEEALRDIARTLELEYTPPDEDRDPEAQVPGPSDG